MDSKIIAEFTVEKVTKTEGQEMIILRDTKSSEPSAANLSWTKKGPTDKNICYGYMELLVDNSAAMDRFKPGQKIFMVLSGV
jgi:hypothetical protein